MTKTELEITVQDIDHCGIIAGICDEMELVEQIDKLLGNHSQEIISSGQVVKAMLLMSIHLLIVFGTKQVTNLTRERLWILGFFSPACRKYYLLC